MNYKIKESARRTPYSMPSRRPFRGTVYVTITWSGRIFFKKKKKLILILYRRRCVTTKTTRCITSVLTCYVFVFVFFFLRIVTGYLCRFIVYLSNYSIASSSRHTLRVRYNYYYIYWRPSAFLFYFFDLCVRHPVTTHSLSLSLSTLLYSTLTSIKLSVILIIYLSIYVLCIVHV